jgi:homoserine O-succinyltransferase
MMAARGRSPTIGLINNMAPSAQEATTRQFRALLETAAGHNALDLRLFTLLDNSGDAELYRPASEIYDQGIDALIITGAEPTTPHLRDEPYWPRLTELLDWAESNSVPAVLSCLAAHAAALHLDGVARRPLKEKCFGVFEESVRFEHALMRGITGSLRVPHSRWNELTVDDLVDAGYQVLTASPLAGANIFVRKRRSLFLFFQGHPEYEADRLLLEYRRDARRYLAGIRPNYPKLPQRYFDPSIEATLRLFEDSVRQAPGAFAEADFPTIPVTSQIASWRREADGVFGNWMGYVREHRA